MLEEGAEELLISDIQQQPGAAPVEIDSLLKTGGFTKEMMGQTIRDLGSTIKDAKMDDDFCDDKSGMSPPMDGADQFSGI